MPELYILIRGRSKSSQLEKSSKKRTFQKLIKNAERILCKYLVNQARIIIFSESPIVNKLKKMIRMFNLSN